MRFVIYRLQVYNSINVGNVVKHILILINEKQNAGMNTFYRKINNIKIPVSFFDKYSLLIVEVKKHPDVSGIMPLDTCFFFFLFIKSIRGEVVVKM